MRIVIDLQGAQATNANRGIGRYSMALAKAMIRHAGDHDVLLALNAQFPTTVDVIRTEFDHFIAQDNIRVWQTPAAVAGINPEHHWRNKAAQRLREAFLTSLNPDIVHVSSLFEGLVDDAVTSIGIQQPHPLTSMTLYDLIPLIHRHHYLQNPTVECWYQQKLDQLSRSDLCLAISESSRLEAIRYLGFAENSIINISSATDPQFMPIDIDPQTAQSLRQRYHLSKPFIMYTGGMDYRKNIQGLIHAFALLPTSLRQHYQLAIVCDIQASDKIAMHALVRSYGLNGDEVIFTGYVTEQDLISCYNICDLFVFPSLHEGFGLPVLEAMSCGAIVIGSNTSSIVEVIGREDALFNPYSDEAIAQKIHQVLSDKSLQQSLKTHSLQQAQKFSWDISAKRAIAGFEALHEKNHYLDKQCSAPKYIKHMTRPKLAYISPLPPMQTGIADYSGELLPELSRYYEIDVIVDQRDVKHPWIQANCPIRSVSWFKQHSERYQRILYHFGNSVFHHHMFSLLEDYPGVVVLHDFFLSGVLAHMDVHNMLPNIWAEALYHSHGYHALQSRFQAADTADVVYTYPCNLSVLEQALGIISHSDYSGNLAKQWYGKTSTDNWRKIALLRLPALGNVDKNQLKQRLGFSDNDFIICSFGFLGATKLNHILLTAWLSSELSNHNNCHLVFVGENDQNAYGAALIKSIKHHHVHDQVHITGFTGLDTFKSYLAIADIAVQLRSHSRGETSAAVLDAMNYGIPTIVNGNGAMAELADDCVYMLADIFETDALKIALERLWKDENLRQSLGQKAKQYLRLHHAPRKIGDQYYAAIEQYYDGNTSAKTQLLKSLSSSDDIPDTPENWLELAKAIALNQAPNILNQKQLFVDISKLVEEDAKTGIQRVTRGILKQLFADPPAGFRIEPVYATFAYSYRYARKFSLRFLGCPDHVLEDRLIEPKPGDIFLGLDLQPHVIPHHRQYFQQLRTLGAKVFFVVYDLIPFLQPHYFLPMAKPDFQAWLEVITESDGTLCLSRSVAKDVRDWVETYKTQRTHGFDIGWFHLGADLEKTHASKGLPQNFDQQLEKIRGKTSILMVSTIEPRKGYAQALAAVELLWHNNEDLNLVMVGKPGWMVEDLVHRLEQHPEKNQRLFWYRDVSDEGLLQLYQSVEGVLIAANAEGFGLTTIEAALHQKPILIRDIPVFREVAGEHVSYFPNDDTPEILAASLQHWLLRLKSNTAPKSDHMPYLTWAESTKQVTSLMLDKNFSHWIYHFEPTEINYTSRN